MASRSIEDAIHSALKGDTQQNALDFVAHLRAHGIPLGESETYWDVQYQGNTVCFLWIDGAEQVPGPWTIWSNQEPGAWFAWDDGDKRHPQEAPAVDERTKEAAWAHVNFCADCGSGCNPGKRKTILGKPFENVCSSTLMFTNPGADALDCAKKMVDARKSDLLAGNERA